MVNQPDKSLQTPWDHTPPQLSAAMGASMPPSTPRQGRGATPPPKPTLTEIFNNAADPREQIAALRRKLSSLPPTLEYGVKGSVVRAINPERDRQIQKTINALSQALDVKSQQTMKQKFNLKQSNQITPIFNRNARQTR
ncbi:MAG: hypothetical protein KDA86_15945 [Planctomycetaceae bacterium]|nr:hypothetical protein [Planctomycetaceae bacterium]